jgi:hypothetical protein
MREYGVDICSNRRDLGNRMKWMEQENEDEMKEGEKFRYEVIPAVA